MAMKRPIFIIGILTGLCVFGSVLADGLKFDSDHLLEAQKDLHILDVSEPFPLTAIVCVNNDFDCQHADPNLHREVELPSPVRKAIYQRTLADYNKQIYEGPTPVSSVFGKVYRLTIPGDRRRHLYAYHLSLLPNDPGFKAMLLVHDPRTGRISPEPMFIQIENYPEYSPRPWIYFQDIDGDGTAEIFVLSGRHYGTCCNDITMYGLSVEKDLTLKIRLKVKTADSREGAWVGKDENSIWYVVRTLRPGRLGTIHATISISKKRLEAGEWILGYETYKADASGRFARTASEIVDHEFCRYGLFLADEGP
jgi:hypothetical protein